MLPKKNRFSFKNKLPKHVFNSTSFTVRYEKNNDRLKVAVVVGKGVDKRAPIRNRIKRRLLEILRKEVKTEMPLDLVFYIKKNALSSENLESEIKRAINNLAIKQ